MYDELRLAERTLLTTLVVVEATLASIELWRAFRGSVVEEVETADSEQSDDS